MTVIAGSRLYDSESLDGMMMEAMLPNVNQNLVTNMVVPHHGGNAGTQIIVKILFPEKAIVSTDGKSYGHPIDSVLDFLHLLGFQACRTDKNGRPFEVISL